MMDWRPLDWDVIYILSVMLGFLVGFLWFLRLLQWAGDKFIAWVERRQPCTLCGLPRYKCTGVHPRA